MEDKEIAKAQSELNRVNMDLDRARKDAEQAKLQLDGLQRENDDHRSKGWEDKLFKLEQDVLQAEEERNTVQDEADKVAA